MSVPHLKFRAVVTGWPCALLGVLLMLPGCETEDQRPDAPAWTAPTESTSQFPIRIARPQGSGSVATDVLESNASPSRIGCPTCHTEGSVSAIAQARNGEPLVVHASLVLKHGPLACVSCHEAGSPNLLHSADGQSFPISETMRLCSQCHGPIRRAFDHGAHGGMRGYWDLQRGPRTRNDCTTCHDPHAPAHQPITPVPGPNDRFGESAPRHSGSAIEQRFHQEPHE